MTPRARSRPGRDCGAADVGSADGGVDGAPAEVSAPAWRPVLENLDGATSVWGSSEKDVWAVGGPLGNAGFDALVVRFDGHVWRRAQPGKTDSNWWVHGTSATDVWLVGEKGRITHWDGATFAESASGTNATLFGVWATAPNDVWAVGGTPDGATSDNAIVLHYDGSTWKKEDVGETRKIAFAFFKVWGVPGAPGELYVVGEAGAIPCIACRVHGKRRAPGSARGASRRWRMQRDRDLRGRRSLFPRLGRDDMRGREPRSIRCSSSTIPSTASRAASAASSSWGREPASSASRGAARGRATSAASRSSISTARGSTPLRGPTGGSAGSSRGGRAPEREAAGRGRSLRLGRLLCSCRDRAQPTMARRFPVVRNRRLAIRPGLA